MNTKRGGKLLYRLISNGKPDLLLLYGLLLHLIIGFVFVVSLGSKEYTILQLSVILGITCLSTIFLISSSMKSFSIHMARYQKYILLLCLSGFTELVWEFSKSEMLVLLHMMMIIIFSALYLTPYLIWMVAGGYVFYFFIVSDQVVEFEFGILSKIFAVTFGVMIVATLHTVCVVCREMMSQTRKQERELNFEQIGHQHHLATIGQIAASIAHDIRNPLTSIQGFVQLIEKNERRGSYNEYYRIIRSEITRIDTLLREVLVLSKSHTVDAESWQLVQLDVLLERLVMLMQPDALKSNMEISLQVHALPVVMGSEEKLQQVFLNVLRNAFEAVMENGKVEMELLEEDGEAIINIRDSGPGIPEDKMEHLFTPFYTTKSEGTGLGLSICHSIIKAYEGRMLVRNLPDGGAEFTIILPI
jgi:signal transduction histidine kinase